MGNTLTGQVVAETYDSLLKVTDNNQITGTKKRLTDGFGTDTPLLVSTTDVQVDGNFLIESAQFNTATIQTGGVGKLIWNDQDGTLDLGLKGGNVTLQIGQEQVIRVVNKTGSNLLEANYQVVRVDGAQGNRLKVALAQANNDANSAETLGLVTETINDNQEGFITTSGLVNKVNTTGSLQGETWADGDMLYLSGTTAGRLTNVKPTAPTHTVIMGYVVSAHATQGQIYVKVDNGYELDELHNVLISSPTDGQVLAYESATGLWKNTTNGNIGGTITTNYLPKATGSTTIGDSQIIDYGTHVIVNGIGPGATSTRFQVSTVTSNQIALSANALGGGTAFFASSNTGNLIVAHNGNPAGVNQFIIDNLGNVSAKSFIKFGGTSSQFLKADGSVDSTSYQTLLTNPITGSLTTNYLPKATGSTTLADSIIYDNGSQVGIGTTSPNALLDVYNAVQLKGLKVGRIIGGSWLNEYGADVHIFQTGFGLERMRITSGGNVGIGASSPGSKLDLVVSGSGTTLDGYNVANGSVGGIFKLTGASYSYRALGANMLWAGGDGANTYIGTSTNHYLALGTNAFEYMRITSGGNVGIGTSSPTRSLDINGDIALSKNGESIIVNDQRGTDSISIRGAANVNFHTFNGSSMVERMRITSGGNVGIGTSSPSGATNYTTVHIAGQTTALGGAVRLTTSNNSAAAVLTTNIDGGYLGMDGDLPFRFATNSTERMRITSGGNVGIGTSSPDSAGGYSTLSVNGSSGGQITWQTSASKKGYIYNTSSSLVVGADTGNNLIFDAGANERMRITSGGNVGIGTTDPGSFKFGVAGAANLITSLSTQDTNIGINYLAGRTTNGTAVYFDRAGSNIGTIYMNASSVSYNTTSDYRLKEDLKEINGLEKLSKLKVYDFKWKNSEERMDGVIAHELAEVLPYAVTGHKDGEQMQAVDYSKIVPVLVKAIQELTDEVNKLKNK